MKVLVTGSAGHLGEALVCSLRQRPHARVIGIDVLGSSSTDAIGSITDTGFVRDAMSGVDAVIHTAALHKPHIESHRRQQFVDVNVSGTLTLLEAAVAAGVRAFLFTSTTSAFGRALRPGSEQPAAWVTEELMPVPRNIYGVTKTAAEDICQLFHHDHGLPCLVLRTSRFFPEEDDDPALRDAFDPDNLKANELLYRRVDLADVVEAHMLALERAPEIGFGCFIVSATTPFRAEDVGQLRSDPAGVLDRRVPGWREVYERAGWRMLPAVDRVYVNDHARRVLAWEPRYDFRQVLRCLETRQDLCSPLARQIGSKGYQR